jgi:hypothetical protein
VHFPPDRLVLRRLGFAGDVLPNASLPTLEQCCNNAW